MGAAELGAKNLCQGTKLSFRVAADRVERPPEGGSGPIQWDEVFPEALFVMLCTLLAITVHVATTVWRSCSSFV